MQRQPHQLRELPRGAELVRPLLEGGLQGAQRLLQDGLHVHAVADDLHHLGAEGPLPGGVQVVGLVRELQADVVRCGVPELREHGRHHVPAHLDLRDPVALPGQGGVQRRDREVLGSLVAVAGVPAPAPDAPDDDRHVGQPVRPLVLEEAFPELREVVAPVGLEAPDQLSHAAPQEDVVRGALADQGLVAVVPPGGRLPADELVVVLARPRSPFGRLSIANWSRWCLNGRVSEPAAVVLVLTPASAASLIASRC